MPESSKSSSDRPKGRFEKKNPKPSGCKPEKKKNSSTSSSSDKPKGEKKFSDKEVALKGVSRDLRDKRFHAQECQHCGTKVHTWPYCRLAAKVSAASSSETKSKKRKHSENKKDAGEGSSSRKDKQQKVAVMSSLGARITGEPKFNGPRFYEPEEDLDLAFL